MRPRMRCDFVCERAMGGGQVRMRSIRSWLPFLFRSVFESMGVQDGRHVRPMSNRDLGVSPTANNADNRALDHLLSGLHDYEALKSCVVDV